MVKTRIKIGKLKATNKQVLSSLKKKANAKKSAKKTLRLKPQMTLP